jgi:hypothetical protein
MCDPDFIRNRKEYRRIERDGHKEDEGQQGLDAWILEVLGFGDIRGLDGEQESGLGEDGDGPE